MGILILHPKDEKDLDANLELNLDIIAIHGLNGDREHTWTEPKSHKLWLRDFLPNDLPRARVMVFGYDATPIFANSTAGIVEHARDLLRCLVEMREGRDETKRPLIFIGHSLGGLVIKQALIIAERERRYYKHIYQSTGGVIFFGTPHQGSSMADIGTTVARIASTLTHKPDPELLQSLKKGNHILETLTEKFREHHKAKPYDIVSFYETRVMRGFKTLIVEIPSALLTPPGETPTYEEQIPVDATHRDMCRFSSNEDKTYKTAVRCIKNISRGSVTKNIDVKNEFCIVPHTVNPHFTGRNDIRQQLNEGLIEDVYERSRDQQRFVLYGLGGSGKTQMCLKFVQDHRDKFWGIFWIDASSNEMAEEGFMKIAQTCKQEARIESVKQWLANKEHWLLIIDNADDPNLDISKFFPLGTNGTVLITTRNPDFQKYGSAGSCSVEQMCSEDATTLLLKTAAMQNPSEKERQSAEQVAKSLGYLALAIIQAGAVIRQRLASLEGFCELYSRRKKELLESGRPQSSIEYQHSVYTTWEISIKMIEEMKNDQGMLALELLQLCSFLHFDGIPEDIFEKARSNPQQQADSSLFSECFLVRVMPLGWDPLAMGNAIRILASFSLITIDAERRISMHPLVHEFSRSRLPDAERSRAWMTSLVTISTANSFLPGYDDAKQRKLLLPHIDACLSYSEGQLFSPGPFLEDRAWAAMKFALAYRENYRANAIDLSSKSLEIVETIVPSGGYSHIYAMEMVALDLEWIGRDTESLQMYQRILDYKRGGDRPNETLHAINSVAKSYDFSGEHQKAIDMCNDAMREFQNKLGEDSQDMLRALTIVGSASWSLKKLKVARKCFEKVLDIQKRVCRDQSWEVMRELSFVYLAQNQHKKAKALHEELVNLLKACLGPNDLRTIIAMGNSEHFQSYAAVSTSLLSRNTPRRRAKRIVLSKRALEGLRDTQSDINVTTLDCMMTVAMDYFMSGSLEKARIWQEEVAELTIQKWGKDSCYAADALAILKRIRRSIALRNAVYW
ncbi:Protein SERAC1 [Lachnellula occidentalis]|uniref:Protein SERAC1 n=1 Tax=Lachnellula occidentalis TaxID=215460 RepID=A0A8H8UIB2_9HELO|nr:Protein SERAC1 [Lachnellula occidentalis]